MDWVFKEIGQATTLDWLKVIVGLGGLAFGFYRWWYAAERNMHKRLREYLDKQETQLLRAQDEVLEALERPNLIGGAATAPLATMIDLRRVFDKRNHESIGMNTPLEIEMKTYLSDAASALEKRIDISRKVVEGYRQQLVGAYIIRGAISAALAKETWISRNRVPHDHQALEDFRTALRVPGHSLSIVLKRFEAHQLRKLGHASQALSAYEEIEEFAANVKDTRKRDFVVADAKRWCAAIRQSQRLREYAITGTGSQGNEQARQLIKMSGLNTVPGALDIREAHAPFKDWDAIEQGDLHYLAAFLNFKLNNGKQEILQLRKAAEQYDTVSMSTRGLGRLANRKLWKLKKAAQDGQKRLRSARRNRAYSLIHLLPPATPVDDEFLE